MGTTFKIYTDHQSLRYLDTMDINTGNKSKRLARWLEQLQDFDFELHYIKGENNQADGLTRNMQPDELAQQTANGLENQNVETVVCTPVQISGTDEHTLRSDAYFGPILKIVKDNNYDATTPAIRERAKHFKWFNNGLFKMDYIISGDSMEQERGFRQCVAGEKQQLAIITEYHSTKATGHQGQERTVTMLVHDFYWPSMQKMIKSFIAKCDKCQRNKGNTQATKLPQQPVELPHSPGEHISIDFVELPMSMRGNDYMLVVVDKFSKMVRLAPTTKTITSERTAELLLTLVLPIYGRLPSIIISDRDPRFTAQLYQQMWTAFGTTLRMTTAHRPQADGQTERVNRQLQEYLRSFVNAQGTDWDEPTTITMLEFTLNSHTQTTTETSAFELNIGRRAVFPAIMKQPTNKVEEQIPLETRWRAALDAMHKAQEQMVQRNSPISSSKVLDKVVFNPGDEVLLNTKNYPQLRRNKLDAPYFGPLIVKRMPNERVVELELPEGWNIHPIINVESVKRYRRDMVSTTPAPGPILDEDGEENFIIDKIMSERSRRGRKEYKIRWLGYGPRHDTWEPARNIPKLVVDQYTRSKPASQRRAL